MLLLADLVGTGDEPTGTILGLALRPRHLEIDGIVTGLNCV